MDYWVVRHDELVLGPFQGWPVCVRIPIGGGVCGTAVSEAPTRRIDNVHKFDGHIVCDPNSRSEIVVPLKSNGVVIAVPDIDSALEARFTMADQNGIERLCNRFVQRLFAINLELNEFILPVTRIPLSGYQP